MDESFFMQIFDFTHVLHWSFWIIEGFWIDE